MLGYAMRSMMTKRLCYYHKQSCRIRSQKQRLFPSTIEAEILYRSLLRFQYFWFI